MSKCSAAKRAQPEIPSVLLLGALSSRPPNSNTAVNTWAMSSVMLIYQDNQSARAAVLPVVFVVVSRPSGAILVKLTDHPSSLLWRKETKTSFVPGSNSSVVIQCS